MSPIRLFTEHPASVNESYGEHLATASGFGVNLLAAGCACLVHSLLPFLFVRTASAMVERLHTRMVTNRVKQANTTRRWQEAPTPGPSFLGPSRTTFDH